MFWKIFAVLLVGLVSVTYLERVETVAYNSRGAFLQERTKGGTLDKKIFRVCLYSLKGVECTPWRSPSIRD